MSKLQAFANDPMAFLLALVIPSVRGPRRFGEIMADFQRARFGDLCPALLAVSRGDKPPIGKNWWEASKGASKDSDLAASLLWLLAFSKRPLLCQVGAADQDQADELRKAAKDILRLNPWLASRVEVQSWRILCSATGAACEIIAADTAGSHGARPDVLIVNELSCVYKREFAENLMDNAAKVPHGLVVVATNAGFVGSWQAEWRDLAIDSDRWAVHQWAKPAPWLDPRDIEEAEKRNSRSRFMRLFLGQWASGNGDALDADDIAACTDAKLRPMTGDEEGFGFVAGLDLGIKNDRSALVVVGVNGADQRRRLASCEAWSPGARGEVDLEQVRTGVLQAAWRYPGLVVGYDPHQAQLMAQQLRREGVNMVEIPFTGRLCNIMAEMLLMTFRSRTITMFHEPELIADLGKLNIEERSFGYKLTAPRDKKTGHADRATALAIALPLANDYVADYSPPVNYDLQRQLDYILR